MKKNIKDNTKLLLATGLSLGLISQLSSEAATDVTYTGDSTDTQHAQSLGANASSPGAYADITMDYELTGLVAAAIYTAGDITSTEGAALLAGKFSSQGSKNSSLGLDNESDIFNDIIQSGNQVDESTNNSVLEIRGVAYSGSGLVSVVVEPLIEGSTDNLPSNSISVQFNNQTNNGQFHAAFSGTFTGSSLAYLTGNSSAISNTGNTLTDSNNQGTFALMGDVIEGSISNVDDVGMYEGGLRITITEL